MSKMMRANQKTGLYDCTDCRESNHVGRAREKQEWLQEVEEEGESDD